MGLWVDASAAYAQAEGCPNERLRERDGYALRLPDCRAYEQVSPVEKNFADAAGIPGSVQSALLGEGVTFFSLVPFPGVLSAASIPTYLSSRGGGGWSTAGLAPPAILSAAGGSEEYSTEGLTEDLAEAIVLVEPGLEAGMAPGSYSYLRDSATGAFRLLGPGTAAFADAAADDSRIIFESREQILPSATPNVVNLYEWDGSKPPGEELSLAGILPDGEAPVDGSVAGPGGPALGRPKGGATGKFYTQDTISANGSRVFFSDEGTGQIYMRELEASRTIPVSAGIEPAYWRAATVNGSMVFYTEGENLWRFNFEKFEESFNEKKKPESESLAEAREALTSSAAGVLGTLGVSTENGSYAYFVATGVLADNENDNGEIAELDKANLYKWHEGEIAFIAQLGTEGPGPTDWRDFLQNGEFEGPAQGEKGSRVTPNGATVLFTSQAQLTGYDNAKNDELYLYEALSGRLVCVSCNPDGVPATNEAYLANNQELSVQPSPRAFLARNLSEAGSRVFFQTKEALVPQDTNAQTDVYEWEREGAGGADGCTRSSATFSASSDGCLYLVSTGEGASPSYFGDASASGNNVFFFTRQALVDQDQDENYDVYDARVEGGIAAQNPSPLVDCTEEGCLDPTASSPVFSVPSSATFAGVGNLPPAPKGDPKPLTRAQQLMRALKACRKARKPRKKRSGCEARARKRYGKHAARKQNGKRAAKAVHVNKPVRKHHGQ